METKYNNLAAVLHGKNDLRMENVPIPEIRENEVLLRISQVGICGTDLSFLKKAKLGDYILKKPIVIGHEASGIVDKCGSAVKNLKPGDRVCIECAVTCQICDFCKGGRYNLCLDCTSCGLPPDHGTLSRYYKHVADFCFKLPDNVSMEEGALAEPLSVAIHACRRANVKFGSKVLICGAGSIGILNLLTARAMGATKICITDIVDGKLASAKKLGADTTLNVRSGTAADLKKRVIQLMDGEMPDITIECTGAESSIKLGILATKSGGVFALVGLGPDEVCIPIVDAATREVDIIGVFRYVNCFPLALEMMASGKVDVKPMITHRYKLEETLQAFETAKTGAGGAIKVVISC